MTIERTGRLARRGVAAFVTVAAALAMTACAGDIESEDDTTSEDCGTVNIAQNAWAGYYANVAVVSYVLENELGCTVEVLDINEEVSWQGIESGEVDVILENWGHPELQAEYIDEKGVAVNLGPTGNDGIIGWYVPPWLAEEHPEVLDWENLNDFAADFATTESGGKGQLLDGDPSFVTNDEALVANLGLNFQVVYAGSDAGLVEAFRSAEANKTWLIAYFWEPHPFHAEVPLVHVELPPYEEGTCEVEGPDVACDYPSYVLDVIARKEWVDSGSPAVTVVDNFNWTNADQNSVAADIDGGMSYEEAAKKWVDANASTVDAWLGQS